MNSSQLQYLFWILLITILYANAGYAAVVFVLGKLVRSRKATHAECELPTCTLIIPAHNEGAILKAKLQNALNLDYPVDRLDIIVVDDASNDDSQNILSQYVGGRVSLLRQVERSGKSAGLVWASQVALGDVLFLCDANVMFAPDALRHLVSHLHDPQVGAVTGMVVLESEQSNFGTGEKAYYALERLIQVSESRLGCLTGVDGGMYVVRRKLFPKLAYDTVLDDFTTSMHLIRQGYRIVFEPLANATESGTPTAREEYRRRKRLAAGAMQSMLRKQFPRLTQPLVLWQFTSHKLARWLTPWLLLTLLVVNLLLVNDGILYSALLIGQLGFYLLALAGLISLSLRRRFLFAVPFYVTMSNLAMLEGTLRGLFRTESSAWTPVTRNCASTRPEQV